MTKFSKKVISLAVASFVTVSSAFGGNYSAKAATVQAQETTAKEKTYTVHFKMPSTWKGSTTPNIYSYYVSKTEFGENKLGVLKEPSKKWPGTPMTKDTTDKTGKWYTATVTTTVDEANVVFLSDGKETPAYRTPEEYDSLGNKQDGYKITSDVWFDLDTMKTPSTSDPTATKAPTTEPTKAPTVAPTATPINGPQVVADKASGTSYYEEDSDTLAVTLKLAGGATTATYTVDDGPVKTISGSAVVNVGEGKMPHNTPITLKVTSTNGKESNTQTFTYIKKSKVADKYNLKVKSLSQSMTELFSSVQAAATKTTEKQITVNFTAPSTWEATDPVYAYAYYDVDDSTADTVKKKTIKPLGIWPGKKASKNADGTYSTTFTTEIGEAKVIFASVKNGIVGTEPKKDENNQEYYECSTVQAPNGYVLDEKGAVKLVNGIAIPLEGYTVTGDISLETTTDAKGNMLLTPVTEPTTTPTTTPVVTTPPTTTPAGIDGFFGARNSAPQYNTAKQKLLATVINATGDVTYTFIVDNKVIYEGPNNNVDWDPSTFAAGKHTLVATIKDKVSSKSFVKSYTLEAVAPSATPVVTVTPTATPSALPTGTPSATPVVTVTPSAIPTVTPSAVPTVTPSAVPTVTPSAVPTVTPSAVPTVTPSAVPTVTPSAAPTNTPPVVIVPTPSTVPNAPATPAALGGTITLPKAGKTAGETLTIKVKAKNGKSPYKYTYSVEKKGTKTKKLATNTKKTSVTWTPEKSGKYTIKVVITDAAGKKKTITKTYTVKARVITIKSFKTNKKSGQKVKTKIKLTAKATTKKGKVSYQFAVQKGNGKIKTIQKYSKKTSKVWKPTKKGTYKIYVYVKNGKGVTVHKVKTFKIK